MLLAVGTVENIATPLTAEDDAKQRGSEDEQKVAHGVDSGTSLQGYARPELFLLLRGFFPFLVLLRCIWISCSPRRTELPCDPATQSWPSRRCFSRSPPPASALDSNDPTPPQAVYGDLPAGAVSVEILALPDFSEAGDGEVLRPVAIAGEQVHVDGGSFTVSIDPSSVPAGYIQPEGLVDLQIVATGDGQTWISNSSVRLVTKSPDEDPVWVDPVASSAQIDEETLTLGPSGVAARIPVLRAAIDEPETEDDGAGIEGFARSAREIGSHCEWTFDGTTSIRSTTIGTTYPVGDSQARMRVTNSQGAEYGIASRGTAAGAEWYAGGNKFVKDSWGFTWAYSGAQRSYRTDVEYRRYDVHCGAHVPVYLGKEWRPIIETGGVGHNNGITRPDWDDFCVPVVLGTWERDIEDGSAYSYGLAVKFSNALGIDLGIKRNYSTRQYIQYDIRTNQPKELCGSNAYPSRASKLMERFR